MPEFTLLTKPTNPNISQHRYPRRAVASGTVVVHTGEGAMDTIGIDTGAEGLDAFIRSRSDYGSYHAAADSDSLVDLAPFTHETWHVAADLHNWHSWGISAACRTVDWDPESAWTKATIARMGKRIAEHWIEMGLIAAARNPVWITRAQALRHETGLILHGEAQPGDRTDAWDRLPSGAQHPHKTRLKQMLVDAIRAAANGIDPLPPTTNPDDEEQDIMGAAADITKKIEASQKAVIDTMNRNDQDTRVREGYVALKLHDLPDQYLLFPKPDAVHSNGIDKGLAKVHLVDDADRPLKRILKKQNTIQFGAADIDDPDGPGGNPPGFVDYVKLTPEESHYLLGWPDF